jgi:hypothetical protein
MRADAYCYVIETCKLTKRLVKYADAPYAYAHQMCMLRTINNDQTALEELRLGTEGVPFTP